MARSRNAIGGHGRRHCDHDDNGIRCRCHRRILMGADKGAIPPNLAPNKFRERLSRPSRMQENLFAAGALPGPRCGSLQRSSRPTSWFEGGWLPPSRTPSPLSTIWASSLTRNRRLGPSQRDGPDPPLVAVNPSTNASSHSYIISLIWYVHSTRIKLNKSTQLHDAFIGRARHCSSNGCSETWTVSAR